MNKALKLINVLILLNLWACSSFEHAERGPSSSLDGKSCRTLLNQIRRLESVSSDSQVTTDARSTLWEWVQGQTSFDTVDAYTDLLKMNLTSDEVSIVTSSLRSSELQTDRMNYILWASGQLPKNRSIAFSELALWNSPEETKQLRKFLKSRKKFDSWEEKRFKKLVEDAGDDANLSVLKVQARKQREVYEKLKYACTAKVPNSDNAQAGKNFSRFIMTVGPLSVVAGYTVANWQELKDSIHEMQEGDGAALKMWFKQLGYDLSIGMILSYTIGRIFSEPTGTYFQKVAKGYGADMVLGVADMFAYNFLFPQDDKLLQKRFSDLKKDPEFKERVALLHKRLDDVGFLVKFKSTLIGMVKDAISKGEQVSFPEAGLLNVTVADLERPEVQKVVLKALAAELYYEGRYGAETPDWPQSIIYTGEGGGDRLFFYAGVGPLYHTVNIFIGARIYQTICMGKDNLGRAFAQAAVLHTLWAFGYNLFEFPLRSQFINQ